MPKTMSGHEYNVQKLLLLDLYWEGTITFPQYCEQLTILECEFIFGASEDK